MYIMTSPTILSESNSRSRSKKSPTTRSKSRSHSRSNRRHIVSIGHDGEMGEPSGRGRKSIKHRRRRKHKTRRKHRTKHCKCKKPCKCKKTCKCKRKTKHRKKKRKKRRTKKRQRGGSKMLNSSNYPNPLPKGGPWSPGSDSNGLGKGYYYKNNTDPFLPNPQYNGKSFNMKGGGFFDLAKNLPGGTDLYDAYWKGSNVVKNTYQTWKGGKQYVDPNPSVQPSLDKPPVQYSPAPDLTHITKTSQTKAAAYDNN